MNSKCFEYFASEKTGGGIDVQGVISSHKNYIYDNFNGSFIHKNKAEYTASSTFVKGGGGSVRCEKNIHRIKWSYLDFDSDKPLEVNDIINRCKLLGLPQPTYIINTSPNHYHVIWEYRQSLPRYDDINNTDNLSFWKTVENALIEAFKSLGVDENAKDPVRILRNPHNTNAKNRKRDDFPIKLVHKGSKTSLSSLYNPLKEHGFITKSNRNGSTKYGKGTLLSSSRAKLREYLMNNNYFCMTQKELGELLGIKLRTIKLLIKEFRERGMLSTKTIHIDGKRMTSFTYNSKVHISNNSILKDTIMVDHCSVRTGEVVAIGNLVRVFNSRGLPEGLRDTGIFTLSRLLAGVGYTEDEIFLKLSTGYLESNIGVKKDFTEDEFKKCIRNGCKLDKYPQYPWKNYQILVKHYNIDSKYILKGIVDRQNYHKTRHNPKEVKSDPYNLH